jgi:AAA ATPase domain
MKLISAHVTNFRSVEDSEKFSVEQVTCLVGKNEAGKSAILLALAALNPHPNTPAALDKERDYPRRYLTAYEERHPGGDAIAVSTEWQLSAFELEAVAAELGQGVLTNPVVKVFRRYGANQPEWEIGINIEKAVDHALAPGGFDETQLATLRSATTKELIAKLSGLPSPTPEQQKILERLKAYGSLTNAALMVLRKTLPTFMYFSNYDRMEGAVQFEQLQQLKASSQLQQDEYSGARLFLEFMDYAGVPTDDILTVNTYETFNARLQGASNNIHGSDTRILDPES